MVTNNTIMGNSMIKTEKITRHTLHCPNCYGSIRLKPHKSFNEFDALLKEPRNKNLHVAISHLRYLDALEFPTCTNCGKMFEIKIDSKTFTIEIKEL